MVKCKLECLDPQMPGEDLPDGVEVIIGRTPKYRIRSLYCSRKQILIVADCKNKHVTITVLGKGSPTKVDGNKIYAGDKTVAKDGSLIEIAYQSVKYRVVFYDNIKRDSPDSPQPTNKRLKKMMEWKDFNNQEVLIGTSSHFVFATSKIASFDLDDTLITTKSGCTSPISNDDWKLWDPTVQPKIKKLFNDGFSIVIFTNQARLSTTRGKNLIKTFIKKLQSIVEQLDVPVLVFISTKEGYYRKPAPGMWELMASRVPFDSVDLKSSFYCGDAAGRPHNWKHGKNKDFAMSDRLFAINNKLNFFTPEELFLNERAVPFIPISFNPGYICERAKNFKFVPSESQEVIVMAGPPASGKSHFVKTHIAPTGYKVINCDELGSWQKCVELFKTFLNSGSSVVIDNTNPDRESRAGYLEICKEKNITARCLLMAAHKERCHHNTKYRQFTQPEHIASSASLFLLFSNKYQPPKSDEGFTDIVTVPFIPSFNSDEEKRKYLLYLIPK